MTSRAERCRNERRQQEALMKAGLLSSASESDPAANKKKKKRKKEGKLRHDTKKHGQANSSPAVGIDTDILFHLALCALYISFNFIWFWTIVAILGSLFLQETEETNGPATKTTTSSSSFDDYSYYYNCLVVTIRSMCRALLVIQIIDMIIPFQQRDEKKKSDTTTPANSSGGSSSSANICGKDTTYTPPSSPPPLGYWPWLAKITDNTESLKKYNSLEVIVEGENDDEEYENEHQYDDDGDKRDGLCDGGMNKITGEGDGTPTKKNGTSLGGGNVNNNNVNASLKQQPHSQTLLYDKDKHYLLCYFPHSLYGAAIFPLRKYFQDHHDGMTLLYTGADVLFKVPILGRFMSWWGLTKVSKHSLIENLTKLNFPYNMIMIQPDGIQGMFYGLKEEQIVLQKRKGFCKIALRTGASLVPCYVMGVNQLYNRWWGPTSIAAKLSHRLHISFVFWTDRFGIPFGFIPRPVKIIVVVGKPIDVPKTDNPTNEQVIDLHTKFVTELKALYDRHKYRMGSDWATKYNRLYLEDEQPTTTGKV